MRHAIAPTRDRLITAATALFQKQGYFGTGVAEILVEANAPKGSLYHHFPTGKAELACAAVAKIAQETCCLSQSAFARGVGLSAQMPILAQAMAAWLRRTDYQQGPLLAMLAMECATREPSVAEAVRKAYQDWRDVLRAQIVGAPKQSMAQADLIIVTLEGAMMLARLERRDAPLVHAGKALAVALAD
jgi:TetR/AcrR family transcriptional regulator, lmrAB and yxaGH operons repressor